MGLTPPTTAMLVGRGTIAGKMHGCFLDTYVSPWGSFTKLYYTMSQNFIILSTQGYYLGDLLQTWQGGSQSWRRGRQNSGATVAGTTKAWQRFWHGRASMSTAIISIIRTGPVSFVNHNHQHILRKCWWWWGWWWWCRWCRWWCR